MIDLKAQDAKQKGCQAAGDGYSIPESDALGMLGDAHSTNYAENRDFFLNQNNPTNFERTWTTAYFLYKKINAVTEQERPFDQVMDFSIIQKLGAEQKLPRAKKNEYDVISRRRLPARCGAKKDEITHQDRRLSTSSRTRWTSTRRSRGTRTARKWRSSTIRM